jgi:membrane protein DedA with SNARE-associated domain
VSDLIDGFITNYGVLALFLGCFVEGESIAIAGGILAHHHLFPIWQAVVAVFAGAYVSDVMWFYLGRRLTEKRRIARILHHPKVDRLRRLVDRNPLLLAPVFRFVPGMRIVGPVVLAQSRILAPVYMSVTALSAAVWAVVYVFLGHWVGAAIIAIFGRAHRAEHLFLLAAALFAVGLIWAVWRWRKAAPRG